MDEIMNTVDHCNKLISERRSVFPASYTDRKIDKDIILQILENANYAPTHRLTQPWRFKVMEGEKEYNGHDVMWQISAETHCALHAVISQAFKMTRPNSAVKWKASRSILSYIRIS